MIDGDYMNNKGFAVSTLIYGLSIMGIMLMAILMGIMSVNRNNNRTLANEVEKDLNKFIQTETTFNANAAGQTYTVPEGEAGWYKIELWGASGGTTNKKPDGTCTVSGGLGAYTSGVIELEEEDKLYFYVGSATANGGGSTDVRLIDQTDATGVNSRIMVAAGGGKSAGSHGGTLVGYNSTMISAGGKVRMDGVADYALTTPTLANYPTSYSLPGNASFTSVPSAVSVNNGGSGYYSSTVASVGGKSFIAGYAGAKGMDRGTVWNNPGVRETIETYDEDSGNMVPTLKMFYFVDGLMLAGVNDCDGKARIERIVRKTNPTQKLIRSNTKLNGVQSITDCVEGSSDVAASKISAIAEGQEKAGALTYNGKCATANLGGTFNLDELSVWHAAGKDYTNHTITVQTSGGQKTLKAKATSQGATLSETETPVGFRISAYQPDFTTYIPDSGNYYIIPVLTENKVLTAQADSDSSHNPIKVDIANGYKRQKWSIKVITSAKVSPGYRAGNKGTYEYSITELARHRALNILNDENKERNQIGAANEFNAKRRNDPQIWKLVPMGNGTYTITTVVPRFTASKATGNIFAQMDQSKDKRNEILIAKNNNNTERFKLISLDYSSS